MESSETVRLRADAVRNRRRVAEAARSAFAELGVEAPMIEIARRAGVGTATLYRRFPTREDLLELVFDDRIEQCAHTVDRFLALAATNPWGAFAGYLNTLFALQRADRAFTSVLLHTFPPHGRMEQERQRALVGLNEIIRFAKSAGVLRGDFDIADLALLLRAHQGAIASDRTEEDESWLAASHRTCHLLLDACRAQPSIPAGDALSSS